MAFLHAASRIATIVFYLKSLSLVKYSIAKLQNIEADRDSISEYLY